ncbi:MAG: hypothetical protein COX20_13575 [Desulfobacterales bacterium CG23_combo_of_CG06-09_8_20_14_all_52_9]|nr:MAG: hypothetical protein COX20_13575 [Desulfobacterales bacterium CG23_combo_of_CG06-09_8_20_14_all_52_9]
MSSPPLQGGRREHDSPLPQRKNRDWSYLFRFGPASPIHEAPSRAMMFMAHFIQAICLVKVVSSNRPSLWPFPEKSKRRARYPT